jgi:hypothetical protein
MSKLKESISIDVTKIPPQKPVLHHKVEIAEILAKQCLRAIKAVRKDEYSPDAAVQYIAMKRGIAVAIDADKTFIQKIYKLGAGIPGLVVSTAAELSEIRRHDLLFDSEGKVYEVVKAPNEPPPWDSPYLNEVTVRNQPGQLITIREADLGGWNWIGFAAAKGEVNV